MTGEYVRVVDHTSERAVREMLAVPGGAVAGARLHPAQDERFEVLQGLPAYRRGDERGQLRAGESLSVPAGVMHDWWNAGDENLRARVTVTPPGSFAAMIGAVWGSPSSVGPTQRERPAAMRRCSRRRSARRLVLERPPRAIQRALVALVARIARRRGRSVTSDEVIRASIVAPERWPARTFPRCNLHVRRRAWRALVRKSAVPSLLPR